MTRARHIALPALVVCLVLFAGFWLLGAASPWWDEGWTLSVARTWVEHGFYGRLLDGQLVAPGLEAAFPVTDLVALSLRLFGVGVWQGRLPIVLCAFGALALMVYLAQRLYRPATAWATLVVLLLLPAHSQLNGLLMGRQVLAELPMLFYLLVGYTGLLLALRRRLFGLPLAVVFLALGLLAKLQAVPFVLASLLLPLALLLIQRRWRYASITGGALLGAWLTTYALDAAQRALVAGHTLPKATLTDLMSVTALVPVLELRPVVLRTMLIYAMPHVLGVAAALWQLARRDRLGLASPEQVVRCALLVFTASWFVWFVAFSIGWIRYLLPAVFIGSMFAAEWLVQLVDADPRAMLHRLTMAIQRRRLDQPALRGLVALLLLAALLPAGLRELYYTYAFEPDTSAMQAAAFLNAQPLGSRIETYESELHFLLNQPYHFPPDQVHVAIAARTFLSNETPLAYDALSVSPDYIVVGPYARFSELYTEILGGSLFRLVRSYGVYDIYEHVQE